MFHDAEETLESFQEKNQITFQAMTKVSIIIPCYSVERYLNRCMDTIVNQTLKDIEIILVDDKSPDRVPEMCDEWAKKDKRIKVIHKKKNEGLGLARNTGLEIATGDYVAFVDSDDYVDTEMFSRLYEKAVETQSDIVYCGVKREITQNNFIDVRDFNEQTIFEKMRCRNYPFVMLIQIQVRGYLCLYGIPYICGRLSAACDFIRSA